MLNHGGKRMGAGRKKGSGAFGEATKVVRIPESQVETVKLWLDNYKEHVSDASLEKLDAISGMLEEATTTLPLYSHKVAAGFPSPADDYIEARLDLNEKLAPNFNSTFLLKVQGESMRDAGIFDGDILVVDRSITPRSGKIVIAALDGELTVKRLAIRQDGTYLLPENPDFPEIPVHSESDMVIWGVVTSCIHQF
ncbi:SOS (error prone) mutagenesis protein UmuD (RumA) [Thiosulfatimonas sediminis]|uniref:SOS (Error prone) mutagenesis protein UmuD (RumA) n=1 Tax=Thiosulfatimonas sediminis TaxID=2675054 RepID=A0A6F8PT69_9GAMM|nr:translesion error-prone DNA polymerase V autoproteolytic subunit [Thiosulfatimonas sediminis]BBP45224.1 SOS (error prone) mutagenesis protein UmuD (RumA) [Thiosulfatimonas sediminis]